jgi:hypothetical protein
MSRGALAGLALLAALTLPTLAAARTGANPEGRALPAPITGGRGDAAPATPARALAPRADGSETVTSVYGVPLPAGAIQIDSTYYDLQDLGTLGTRITTTPDGRVHVTWMDDFCDLDAGGCPPNVNAPQPYPERAMGYAYRDANFTWEHVGKVRDPSIWGCCLSEHLGGFGTIAILPDGRAAITQHMDEDGCDLRGDLYVENASGGSTWTAYLTPIVDPSTLFPQTVALPNGQFVIFGEIPRVTSNCTHCGVNDMRISRLASLGTPFVCPTGWQSGTWSSIVPMSMFRNGYACFPAAAAATDGRMGVAVTDFGGNAWLLESSDGSFAAGTVTIRNLTKYYDSQIVAPDSTSNQWRPYINCALAYNDTTPHVVWAEVQARKIGSTIVYADYRARIRHWDSVEGLSTVRQVQPGEADSYDNVDNGYAGPIAGFNTISADWPQVGFSPDGSETLVAWVRFTDAEVDTSAHAGVPDFFTGVGYGDIVCAVKRSGQPWSPQQDLTNTPKTDERYPAIPQRNAAGHIQLLFQASATNEAGIVQGQDRGTQPVNLVRRIAYLEAPLASSVLAVDGPGLGPAGLRAWPNPSRGRVRFAAAARDADGAVLVYGVNGALVARVRLGASGEAEWDGRDAHARPVPNGVYFARIEGRGAATRLLFLR